MAPSGVALAGDENAQISSKPRSEKKSNGHQQSKSSLELICIGPLPSPAYHNILPLLLTGDGCWRRWRSRFEYLLEKGYIDGMAGHISVRDPEFPHTFWTNPLAKHFALMKASDMIRVDYEGQLLGGNTSKPINTAGFLLHSAVHKARENVMAACHTHSVHGMAWSAFARPLEMLNQDIAYLYGEAQAVYKDFGGTVLEAEESERAAAALGFRGKGMILQNHGLFTVGSTVDEACFLMTLMERACQCQLLAEAAAANGIPKVCISEESAKYTCENSSDPETLYWEAQPDLEYEACMSGGVYRE